ncbi:methyltransferase domain-containing protein [Ornithinibacillus salinisoli]|uniref:Methyltransferase domain-containing protein n=1 Tax=Ornithinibacillus salinisoli TaxID=1848459 RepID=A0ABW4VYA4_9BACI
MLIKEVAEKLNTTARSIRFYEEKGLISPKKDEENDYRYFTEKDLLRLSTILALREVGFPVNEIKVLLEDPSMSIQQYLNIQRSALYEKWIEMRDMIETIDEMVDRTTEDSYLPKDFYALAQHLKNLKSIRKNWTDRWNFDQQASDYDENIKKQGFSFNVHEGYDQALARIVEKTSLQPGNTCLDIGIGTGNLGSKFLQDGIKVIGVDQSEKMLEKCKEKHPQIETRKGHFLALPILDHSVDAVVSSYALHHLPDEEKVIALEEMTRVLKPNGQICIADLMFTDKVHREKVIADFQAVGNQIAIECIADEYYADRSLLTNWFSNCGYQIESYQFNRILGMIYARRHK